MIKPIVLDMEMSGLDSVKCGIWQIGAIDLDTMEEFFGEARIDDEDIAMEEALKITGKTKEELRDLSKQSQKNLLEKFFAWVSTRKMKNFVFQNFLDSFFLDIKSKKYNLENPIHHRAFDTHSIAQTKYFELNKKFLTEDGDHSQMGLKNILKMCGMEDNRDSHNALEDAKLTAECFSRLMFGEKLLEEYEKYEIPMELKK